jgi:hypothetical protein
MNYQCCSKCDKEKHESEFYSNGSGKLKSICKDCVKIARKSDSYRSAQERYNLSEKGRERHHRYNTSERGRGRNLTYYWGTEWAGGGRASHRDERCDSADTRRKLARIKKLGGTFQQTNVPNYNTFIVLPDTQITESAILSRGVTPEADSRF